MPSESFPILESFQRCLELRDKYMLRSGQTLGFNPKDHDGIFQGLDTSIAGVSGVKPDSDYASAPQAESPFKPWKIYPRPPPPHWHWKGKETLVPSQSGGHEVPEEEFDFAQCEIPGLDEQWRFELDKRGVFQVYDKDVSGTFLRLPGVILRYADKRME